MPLNAGLLPHRPPVDEPERDTRVVSLGSEEAASLCGSLASETATSILSRLFEEPTTASELAECVDTSLQNAHYHLERLRDSGLIRVVDTWYSSRGVEMKVYAPAHDELVIAPGRTDGSSAGDARGETDRTDDQHPDDGETPPLVVGQSD
jgi:DNA-binding transcriptional ArsR family regulator